MKCIYLLSILLILGCSFIKLQEEPERYNTTYNYTIELTSLDDTNYVSGTIQTARMQNQKSIIKEYSSLKGEWKTAKYRINNVNYSCNYLNKISNCNETDCLIEEGWNCLRNVSESEDDYTNIYYQIRKLKEWDEQGLVDYFYSDPLSKECTKQINALIKTEKLKEYNHTEGMIIITHCINQEGIIQKSILMLENQEISMNLTHTLISNDQLILEELMPPVKGPVV